MLIPKQKVSLLEIESQEYRISCYMVFDTEECAFVENRTFSVYATKEECQSDIDFFNSLNVIKAS